MEPKNNPWYNKMQELKQIIGDRSWKYEVEADYFPIHSLEIEDILYWMRELIAPTEGRDKDIPPIEESDIPTEILEANDGQEAA